jgi:hypothetical protein
VKDKEGSKRTCRRRNKGKKEIKTRREREHKGG